MARADAADIETRLFINGEFVNAIGGKTFDTVDVSRKRKKEEKKNSSVSLLKVTNGVY